MKRSVMSSMEGRKAPDFTLQDQNGTSHRLSDYQGRSVIFYWYPKDNTPGCTKESCGFRDHLNEFEELGAVVLGASILDTRSKARFANKYALRFPLLADPDHEVAEKYGVWKKKTMYGKLFFGINRETFLIGPDGMILRHWEKAGGNERHSEEVLQALRELIEP